MICTDALSIHHVSEFATGYAVMWQKGYDMPRSMFVPHIDLFSFYSARNAGFWALNDDPGLLSGKTYEEVVATPALHWNLLSEFIKEHINNGSKKG